MTHKSTALQIAGRTIRIVNVDNRLYVPMRFFVEDALDMHWSGQRKRLATLARRWKMADLLVAGQRKVVQQPCLPVGLVLPYLWLLRPTRPDTLALLERLRDGWDNALMAYLKFDGGELANTGSFLLAEIERATAPLIAQIEALEMRLAKAQQPILNVVEKPINARWRGETMKASTFLEIARLNSEGKNNQEIADAVKMSRTTVSLFLDGKYKSGHAQEAWSELQATGWIKNQNKGP